MADDTAPAKVKLSQIRAQFPMYADVPTPQFLAALHRKLYADMPRADFLSKIDYDTERKDLNADKGWGQRALANIGAGMTDLGQGAQSLWADMTGSDADKARMESDVADKRAIDQQLADSTTGGKALQITGKALPLMVIPGLGVAANAGRAGLAASGALSGALGGALEARGKDESRTGNIALGGALGAGLGAISPEIGQVLGATGRAIMSPLQTAKAAAAAARSPIQTIGNARARDAVSSAVTEGLAPTAQRQALADVADQLAPAASPRTGLPLSTAAQLGDEQLARLEAGSRARNGANWYGFDQAQAKAADDMLTRATAEAEQVGARKAARTANYMTARGQAMDTATQPEMQQAFAGARDQFRQNLDTALMSPEASDPAVRNMLSGIANEMDRVGEAFGPEHLATIRANLSAKYNPMSQNAYVSAPRSSPATISVKKEVDDILNGVTGGHWQNAVDSYTRDSGSVDAAKAAGRARAAFRDPETERVLGKSADIAGEVPIITETGLTRALNAARMPGTGAPGLSPDALQQMNGLMGDLRRQSIVQQVKRSATAGGGSNTASDQIAAQAADAAANAVAAQVPMGRTALDTFRGLLSAPKDRALAQALQQQDVMAQMLRDAANKAPRPGGLWSPDDSEVMQLVRGLRGGQ